jgi:hypothetical protein
MRRILLSVVAAVLSLTLTASAEAGSKGGSKGGSNSHSISSKGNMTSHTTSSHDYHMKNSYKLKSGGYYYKGKDHSHWSYRCYDRRYGCTCYYDSGLCCYYYWCEPDDCYYPVSYCPYGKYSWSSNADGADDD